MRKNLFLVFLLPFLAFSQEHDVPIGTKGNRLVFTVKNPYLKTIKECFVTINAAPEWMEFEGISFNIDSIAAKGRKDAEFIFKVLEGEAGRTGTVQIGVKDKQGQSLAERWIVFKAVLESKETKLFAPYPNPANPSATIRYVIADPSRVRLDVYNIRGQKVRTLLDEDKPAGQWSAIWDGKDDRVLMSSSGVYIICFKVTALRVKKQFVSKILLQK